MPAIEYDPIAKSVIVHYSDDEGEVRNVVMEFEDEGEGRLASKVINDPNFWVSILRTLSSSIKETIRKGADIAT